MMKLGISIPYLKKIQKIYESSDIPWVLLTSAFFHWNEAILLFQEIQIDFIDFILIHLELVLTFVEVKRKKQVGGGEFFVPLSLNRVKDLLKFINIILNWLINFSCSLRCSIFVFLFSPINAGGDSRWKNYDSIMNWRVTKNIAAHFGKSLQLRKHGFLQVGEESKILLGWIFLLGAGNLRRNNFHYLVGVGVAFFLMRE